MATSPANAWSRPAATDRKPPGCGRACLHRLATCRPRSAKRATMLRLQWP